MNDTEDITEWYRKKADRISRVEGIRIEALASKSVTLYIEEDRLHHYANQVMIIVSAILLSKWCTHINVILPKDVAVNIPTYNGKNLKAVLEDIIRANDDEIKLEFYEKFRVQTNVLLAIGGCAEHIEGKMIWIDADGWIAGAGYEHKSFQEIQKTYNMNPVGAVFAACIGQSLLFQIFLGSEVTPGASKWLSLFDGNCQKGAHDNLKNPIVTNDIDFGRILQVGCGAVGSSFDYLLSLTSFNCRISLIDYDNIEIENLVKKIF